MISGGGKCLDDLLAGWLAGFGQRYFSATNWLDRTEGWHQIGSTVGRWPRRMNGVRLRKTIRRLRPALHRQRGSMHDQLVCQRLAAVPETGMVPCRSGTLLSENKICPLSGQQVRRWKQPNYAQRFCYVKLQPQICTTPCPPSELGYHAKNPGLCQRQLGCHRRCLDFETAVNQIQLLHRCGDAMALQHPSYVRLIHPATCATTGRPQTHMRELPIVADDFYLRVE